MAGKKHNIGRYITIEERRINKYLEAYNISETLCGMNFKKTDRNPFAATSDDVNCKKCLKIMNPKN